MRIKIERHSGNNNYVTVVIGRVSRSLMLLRACKIPMHRYATEFG